MAKQLLFDEAARQTLLRGVQKLSRAVAAEDSGFRDDIDELATILVWQTGRAPIAKTFPAERGFEANSLAVGEGVEKRQDDFAAEVASMTKKD